ncbi:hypothetical protein FQA39_LY13174 [Lamprigera yunnana]|nr:hypothetical protein FQA39_LY13174 [Lamprigera yunnana]
MYPSKNQGEPAREKQNTDSKSPNRTTIQRSNKNDLQTENVVAEEYVNKEKATAQNRINMLEQPGTSKKNDHDSISDEDVMATSPVKKPARTVGKLRAEETKLRQNKKVTNALQQKQTMINAQIEEKRKREKRELKVQEVKMALERDKQKNWNLQREPRMKKMPNYRNR